MSREHQRRWSSLLPEIVEVEALRLAFFIVGNHQLSSGLRVRLAFRLVFRVAELLALRLALFFLGPFVQPCPFFLSLDRKSVV